MHFHSLRPCQRARACYFGLALAVHAGKPAGKIKIAKPRGRILPSRLAPTLPASFPRHVRGCRALGVAGSEVWGGGEGPDPATTKGGSPRGGWAQEDAWQDPSRGTWRAPRRLRSLWVFLHPSSATRYKSGDFFFSVFYILAQSSGDLSLFWNSASKQLLFYQLLSRGKGPRSLPARWGRGCGFAGCRCHLGPGVVQHHGDLVRTPLGT